MKLLQVTSLLLVAATANALPPADSSFNPFQNSHSTFKNVRQRFNNMQGYRAYVSTIQPRSTGTTANDFKLTEIPGMTATSSTTYGNWAGQVNVTTENQLFFWFVTSSTQLSSSRPLVLWLNGGPGCSSMDGLWIENGPYRVVDGTPTLMEPNWVKDGGVDIIYLDQPAQTGYSFSSSRTAGIPTTLPLLADQVVTFLENFYKLFPEKSTSPLYLSGESFAGQYIPYIASALLKTRQVGGIAMGNPWTNPVATYNSYVEFAIQNKMLPANSDAVKLAKSQTAQCNRLYGSTPQASAGQVAPITSDVCDGILNTIILGTRAYNDGKCVNLYDIRLTDSTSNCNGMAWPPGIDDMRNYLANNSTAIGINGLRPWRPVWQECANDVYAIVSADEKSPPAASLLPKLAASGVQILIYSGDADFICNTLGTSYLIGNLTWNGATGFQQGNKTPFIVGKKRQATLAGEYISERNLTSLTIFQASHMSPFDQPLATSEMIKRFVNGGFGDTSSGSTTLSTTTRTTSSLSPTIPITTTKSSSSKLYPLLFLSFLLL